MNLKEIQSQLYQEYLREEKDKIFKDKGEVGDIAELGMITEEVGEAIVAVRKKKQKALQLECADVIIRTVCFMSRKGIDLQKALEQANRKNVKRCRKGLFIT